MIVITPYLCEKNEKSAKLFLVNLTDFDQYFLAMVEEDEYEPYEYVDCKARLISDLRDKAEIFKGMITHESKEEHKEWEVDYLEADEKLKADIAYTNLMHSSILLQGKPVIVMIAVRNIAPGEQLGFTYGVGYWVGNAKIMPQLFSKRGKIIPKAQYTWQAIPVQVSTSIGPRIFFYSKEEYRAEIDAQKPKVFHPFADATSFFGLRKKMYLDNALSAQHAPLSSHNSFALQLRALFPENIEFELYKHNPEDRDELKQYNVDLCCKAKTPAAYRQLQSALVDSPIKGHVTAFDQTQEIVIKSVNRNTDKMHQFIVGLAK